MKDLLQISFPVLCYLPSLRCFVYKNIQQVSTEVHKLSYIQDMLSICRNFWHFVSIEGINDKLNILCNCI